MTQRVKKRLYRFALYGRSGSGKTCILTAMSMDRRADPRGRTCSRLPVQSHDPPELHKGKAWLEKAEELLNKGELPDPTGVDLDPPPRYRYEFTTPDREVGYVELIDYSGELINPDDESEHDSLANRLREHFRDLDGILVLAETPRQDRPSSTLSDELRRLREAFGSLGATQEDERRVPVALVLSKWDRQSELKCDDPAVEYERLPAFFDGHVSYRSLVDKLRNSVGDADPNNSEPDEPSLAEEIDNGRSAVQRRATALTEPDDTCNWGVFPVSAFGRSQAGADSRDVPDVTQPLQSLGLEAPFVWLMQRRDVLDLEELNRMVTEMPGWWRPRLWFFRNPVLTLGRRTKSRVPPQGEQADCATRLYNRAWRKLWGNTCFGVLLVLLSLVALQGVGDGIRFASIGSAIDDPTTPDGVLDNACSWLKSYIATPMFHPGFACCVSTDAAEDRLHRIFGVQEARAIQPFEDAKNPVDKKRCGEEYSRRFPNGTYVDKVKKALRDIDRQQEDAVYKPFEEATEPDVKKRCGEEYLRRFPNGAHKDEVTAFLHNIEVKGKEQEIDVWLRNMETELQSVLKLPPSEKKLSELDLTIAKCSQRQNMPHPDFETSAQRDRRLGLQQSATKEKAAELRNQEWQKYCKAVEKAISAGEIGEAGELLAERTEHDEPWQQLVKQFAEHAVPNAKTRVDKFKGNSLWTDAYKFIDKCSEGIGKLKPRCPPPLSAGFEEIVRELTKLRQNTEQEHDKSLYQDVLRSRTKGICGTYLQQAPLATMRAEVQKYERYLTEREGPLDLTVEVKIRWGQGCETGNDNIVVVQLDNTKAIEAPSLVSATGNTTGTIGSYKFQKRLAETVTVYVSIVEDDSWLTFGDDDNGSGGASLKVGELTNFVLRLPNQQGTFFNEALFSLKGIPVEPALPAEWRKSQ